MKKNNKLNKSPDFKIKKNNNKKKTPFKDKWNINVNLEKLNKYQNLAYNDFLKKENKNDSSNITVF